jgi:SAM-dependent methyltransferase
VIDPARSFDRAAEEYERARPGYPVEALDGLPIDAGATVLDLGAGTGKLTRLLVERYATVHAVEPLPAMREILAATVPPAVVHAGSAEAIPLGDASVDAVFAAQAFHWFAHDEAVAEIARVLRGGGVLAVVWNETDGTSLPAKYRKRLAQLEPEPATRRSTEEMLAPIERGPFGSLQRAVSTHEQVQADENVLAFARSVSWIAHRADDERTAIMSELRELLPVGEYTFTMTTEVRWAVRE